MTDEVTISVVGYFDEDENAHCSIALEMDLRGYGDTPEAALAELMDCVEMQISYAHYHGNPEMAFRPADPVWFSVFAMIKDQALKAYPNKPNTDYIISTPALPPAHVIHEIERGYQAT